MAARISIGSAIRPGPYSPQAMSPSFGPTASTPSHVSVARFRCVAGCCHIRTFIAGAIRTRVSVASSSVEARSSARPCAIRAIRSAVAGATTTRSATRDRAICPISASCVRVEELAMHLLARQCRNRKRRHEFRRGPGHDRRHRGPALAQAADQLQRLVGRDPAADDEEYPFSVQHSVPPEAEAKL